MSTLAGRQTATDVARTVWAIDPEHTHVGFSVRHMMITTVRGRFTDVTAELELDEADITRSRVRARVAAASIDTRSEQRDAHLRSGDFFDVENHPELVFESREVRRTGAGGLELAGDLTIRGVTRPVFFRVTEEGRGTDPWGGERWAFAAEARIDRRDFGLTWNQALEAGGVLVSDEVRISLEVQAVRQ